MKKQLHILIPPSVRLWSHSPRAPALLKKLLDKGRLVNHAMDDDGSQIYRAMFDKTPDSIAVAAYERYGVNSQMQNWCIKARPAILTPNLGHLVLNNEHDLGLNDAEVNGIIQGLNQHFSDRGLCFRVLDNSDWIIESERVFDDLVCHDMYQASEQNVADYHFEGSDAGFWSLVLNEIQMWLHSCEVNQQRMSKQQAAVNSLWLWGGGVLPQPDSAKVEIVVSDDLLVRGLAKHSNTECDTFDEFFKKNVRHEQVLLIPYKRFAQASIDDFTTQVLEPAMSYMKTHGIKHIKIDFPNGKRLKFKTGVWWRLFSRGASLEDVLFMDEARS